MYPNKFLFFPSLRQIVCSYVLFYVIYPLLWLSSLISPSSYGTVRHFYLQPFTAQCPSLTHARNTSVFAVLFCQPMSFPGVEYSVLSHSSSSHALSPATTSLATSSPPLGFFVRLSFSDSSIPSCTALLELRRFYECLCSPIR